MPTSATISEKVLLMCQLRKTMQRSVVSQVNSICHGISNQALQLKHGWDGREAYIHVALVAMVHARHVVVHVAVVHVRVIHRVVVLGVASV